MVSPSTRARKLSNSVPSPGWKRARLAGPDAQQTGRRFAAEGQPQQRLRAHQPGAAAEQSRIALESAVQQRARDPRRAAVDRARLEQPNAVQAAAGPTASRRSRPRSSRHRRRAAPQGRSLRSAAGARSCSPRESPAPPCAPGTGSPDCRGWSRSGCCARRSAGQDRRRCRSSRKCWKSRTVSPSSAGIARGARSSTAALRDGGRGNRGAGADKRRPRGRRSRCGSRRRGPLGRSSGLGLVVRTVGHGLTVARAATARQHGDRTRMKAHPKLPEPLSVSAAGAAGGAGRTRSAERV